jgi:hypothetical protein
LIELRTFRLAAWDTPLWVLPNRRDGRYNVAGVGSTQYLALHPLTPWAELIRNEEITHETDIAAFRPPIWTVLVSLEDDPLELTFDNAADYGLTPKDLVADDRRPCQRLAADLRADGDGPRAFIAPSAALPGTRNLVLLEPKVAIPYLWEPLDEQDLPVSLVAEDGRATQGLEGLVHHRASRTKHAALEAWENGDELVFEEPSTAHLAA